MRKGWDDALELQNALHHALRTDEYAAYLRWFSNGQGKRVNFGEINDAPVAEDLGQTHLAYMAASASTAAVAEDVPPMWVANGVIDLVEYAAESFEPEALYETDLIVPSAFCLFERTLTAGDIEGREIAFRAASWGEHHTPDWHGYMVALWRHKDDEDDYTRVPGGDVFKRRIGGSPLLLMHTTAGRWGDAEGMREPANYRLFRQLQVLWRLAKQQVVVGSRQKVSRPTWRHKQNWREIKTVQVFTLRRALGGRTYGDGDGAHYSHRFPVAGHWRNQWYPSLKDHRQIWIDPYVKGPEDAPFVAKDRAVEFVR